MLKTRRPTVGCCWILLAFAHLTFADSSSPNNDADLLPEHSAARRWLDLTLDSIRNDRARVVVHARNLFHVSAAMWDGWAVWASDATIASTSTSAGAADDASTSAPAPRRRPSTYLFDDFDLTTDPTLQDLTESERQRNRVITISYAAYHLLRHRFASSPGYYEMNLRYDALMGEFGLAVNYDPESDLSSSYGGAGGGVSKELTKLLRGAMERMGYGRARYDPTYSDPRAVGVRIARAYIEFGLRDGSNEEGDYENLYYYPVNDALLPHQPGTQGLSAERADRWQPLSLKSFVDQSGIERAFGYPAFLGPEWGRVVPFALREDQAKKHRGRYGNEWTVYVDPGPPPLLREGGGQEHDYRDAAGNGSYYQYTDAERAADRLKFLKAFEMVLHWSSHLDPTTDGSGAVLIDVSPNSIGNATLPNPSQQNANDQDDAESYSTFADWFYDAEHGGDRGTGYRRNPVTDEAYPPQFVPRGDYARVLAEFWADGPDSETPPGHWFSILNDVMDHPQFERRIGGGGGGGDVSPELDPLEYDVKAYLTLGGGMHDAAIAAWSVKGWYDYVRPISVIRWMAENGQRSDPALPRYHPMGLELIPGLVEMVTVESTKPGGRHEALGTSSVDEIAVRCWKGPDYIANPDDDDAGVGWILAVNWWPYQRPTFVTPNFAGYVSGHSTYSRTAAEVLTLLTGSPYLPVGMGEYVAKASQFLVFEDGPSVDVRLQWASYRDASDQCSLSRIWGGIHPPADDIPGRIMGTIIGPQAFDHAARHFDGTVDVGRRPRTRAPYMPPEVDPGCPEDVTLDGKVDGDDYDVIHRRYRAGDKDVTHADVISVYRKWLRGYNCP